MKFQFACVLLLSHLPFDMWRLAEVQQWTGAMWSLSWHGVSLLSTGNADCEALRLKSGRCAFSSSCCLPFLFWRLLSGSPQITLRLNGPLTTAPLGPHIALHKKRKWLSHTSATSSFFLTALWQTQASRACLIALVYATVTLLPLET